ncbi:MAG: histidinol-phosphate transaminase [Oscillospiraceae bacterium]|nr:histidinol-phosphate transaminase [Oscillospiraceae bacterium]
MSSFLDKRFASLEAYVPGEQPKDAKYIKLNTNESPYPPSPAVAEAARAEAEKLNLYCDPDCTLLRREAAALFGVGEENVLAFNGSDEVLEFAFMAYGAKIAFPSISYGFYPVFARLFGSDALKVPLREDMSIDHRDYLSLGRTVVIANPNAPTGLALSPGQIEEIVRSNSGSVVVIDEAYVDFGAESVIPLTKKYDNLLVTRTFSKSHSLAGARLGFGIAGEEIIRDLNTIRNSTNPYNVNRMTQAAGTAAIRDNELYMSRCRAVARTRDRIADELKKAGFELTASKANFLFVRGGGLSGEEIYSGLRKRGVLVRWFSGGAISDRVRVSVGTEEQMDVFLAELKELQNEKK